MAGISPPIVLTLSLYSWWACVGLVLTYSWSEWPWESMVVPFLVVHPASLLCLFQNVCKPAEETRPPPTLQDIKQKIQSYNSREKDCLRMKLVSGCPSPPGPGPSARPWILGLPSEVPPLSSGFLRPRGCGRLTPGCSGASRA